MIEEVMRSANNFFERLSKRGEFVIEDGQLQVDFVVHGQFYRIEGSIFNDGVHRFGDPLTDEAFCGSVSALCPPPAFLKLCDEIAEWQEKNGKPSAFQSESFGSQYSYTKATKANGAQTDWQDAFSGRLRQWRKI